MIFCHQCWAIEANEQKLILSRIKNFSVQTWSVISGLNTPERSSPNILLFKYNRNPSLPSLYLVCWTSGQVRLGPLHVDLRWEEQLNIITSPRLTQLNFRIPLKSTQATGFPLTWLRSVRRDGDMSCVLSGKLTEPALLLAGLALPLPWTSTSAEWPDWPGPEWELRV